MHAILPTILLLLLLKIYERNNYSHSLRILPAQQGWGIGRPRDLQRQIEHVRKVAFIQYILQILTRNCASQAKNCGWILCPEDLYECFVLS